MSEVKVYPDLADLVWAGAEQFVTRAKESITARGVFHVALSGGQTPLPMFALVALPEWRARVDWSRVQVYWADERCVPPDDGQSNYRGALTALLEPVGLPEANIHRIQGEIDPAQAADAYDAVVRALAFDLIFLGMGDDGHTASLFPGTGAALVQDRDVMAVFVPKLSAWRVTLTPRAINRARHVVLMVAGPSKAEPLRAALRGPYQPDALPVQNVRPASGALLWLVDQYAAAGLKE